MHFMPKSDIVKSNTLRNIYFPPKQDIVYSYHVIRNIIVFAQTIPRTSKSITKQERDS